MQPLPVSHAGVPGQVEAALHEPPALQSTSHPHELPHPTPPSQESGPQATVHRPVPQTIGPPHDWPPVHVTLHDPVAGQAIAPSHESWPQMIVETAALDWIEPPQV